MRRREEMGKRKGRTESQESLISADEMAENGEEEAGKGTGFFACYLLTSLCPRFKGHTYIGYTLNPRRRIRQHNGEIGCGAWRTKRKRPWEMVLCIYGFPTNVAALQFEWAWQHPVESLAVRNAASTFKSLSGLANKIKLAYTMLTLPAWQSLNLTVNLFSTKYQSHTSACPPLPQQMRTQVCSMGDLPCYNTNACVNDGWDDDDNEFECSFHESKESESTGAVREINKSPRNSIRQEDQGRSSSTNISPAKTSFSFGSVFEDLQSPGLVNLTTDIDEPLNKRSTTALVADEDQPLIKSPVIRRREVEIIDILTPSPCYRINSGKKKRRPTLCPEIIDLTNSPLSV